MYKIGDYVKLVKSNFPEYEWLVGHCATVIETIRDDGVWLEFDDDEPWADDIYIATVDEIRLEE